MWRPTVDQTRRHARGPYETEGKIELRDTNNFPTVILSGIVLTSDQVDVAVGHDFDPTNYRQDSTQDDLLLRHHLFASRVQQRGPQAVFGAGRDDANPLTFD